MTHPNQPFLEAKDVFYGIEIEVAMPLAHMVHFAPTGYSHLQGKKIAHYPKGWKATNDQSIHPPYGYVGVEIVSPKLKGFDGIVQLVQVLDDLAERGAISTEKTGIHIHIDGTDIVETDIAKLKKLYVQYEKVLFGVMGPIAHKRYENGSFAFRHYCKPSSQCDDSADSSDKYRALNLVNYYSFEQKKTVEFRLFSGEGHNLHPENIITYLYMCMALVVRSRNCTRVHPLAESKTLPQLAKKFIDNVLSTKINQIVPEYEPETPEDGSMWSVLDDMIPESTVTL